MVDPFPVNGIYLLLGLSGSGKSVLLNYLAYQMRKKFDYAIGFSTTKFRNSLSFIPDELIYESFRPDIMEKIIQKQKASIQVGQEIHCAVFLDDVLGDSEMKLYGNLWRLLASSCRHYNMTIFLTSQYAFALPPIIRRNAMRIYITSAPCEEDVSVLFKEFGRRVSQADFRKLIDRATEGFSCLQIDPKGKSPGEMYKTITAAARLPRFVIGA